LQVFLSLLTLTDLLLVTRFFMIFFTPSDALLDYQIQEMMITPNTTAGTALPSSES
jgi:hypothetical protein